MRPAGGGSAARGGTARGPGNWSRPRVRLLRGSARRRAGQRRGAQGCWRLAVRRPHGGGQKGRGALRPHGCRKRGRGMRKAGARRRAAVAAFPARGDPVSARRPGIRGCAWSFSGTAPQPAGGTGPVLRLCSRAAPCAAEPCRVGAGTAGPERRPIAVRIFAQSSRRKRRGRPARGTPAPRTDPHPSRGRARRPRAPSRARAAPASARAETGAACRPRPAGRQFRARNRAGGARAPRAGPPPEAPIRVRRGRHRAGARRARGPIGAHPIG